MGHLFHLSRIKIKNHYVKQLRSIIFLPVWFLVPRGAAKKCSQRSDTLSLPLVEIFVDHGMITNQAHGCWGGSRGWFGWFV